MQINSNLTAMMQLEKKLEQSANELAKMNLDSKNSSAKQEKNVKQQIPQENEERSHDTDLIQEMVSQIEIPLAYGANGKVVSVQSSIHQTLLDIKA